VKVRQLRFVAIVKSLHSGLTEPPDQLAIHHNSSTVANHLPKDFHRLKLSSVDSIRSCRFVGDTTYRC
jgi:hypothetical protein